MSLLSIGEVLEVKDHQLRIKTRGVEAGWMDILSQQTKSKKQVVKYSVGDHVIILHDGSRHIVIGSSLALEDVQAMEEFKDAEEVTIYDGGAKVIISKGSIKVDGFENVELKCKNAKVYADEVELGTEQGIKSGVVTMLCRCSLTGAPHPEWSNKIKAEK